MEYTDEELTCGTPGCGTKVRPEWYDNYLRSYRPTFGQPMVCPTCHWKETEAVRVKHEKRGETHG